MLNTADYFWNYTQNYLIAKFKNKNFIYYSKMVLLLLLRTLKEKKWSV